MNKFSTDSGSRRKEIAEVVTQTYDYMIAQGLCYGYANGGKTFLFQFIDPNDPETLL